MLGGIEAADLKTLSHASDRLSRIVRVRSRVKGWEMGKEPSRMVTPVHQARLPMVNTVGLSRLRRQIGLIEAERSMTSEAFISAFRSGELPETEANVEWARLIATAQSVASR